MSKTPAVPQSALEAAGAVVSPTSLTFTSPDVEWDALVELGAFVGEVNRACAWWVGDLVLYLEEHHPDRVAQIDEVLGLSPQTISNRTSVARHIPPSRRRSLPFGTHAEVAYLDPKERDDWLKKAEEGKWNRATMRENLRRERGPRTVITLSSNSGGGSVEEIVEILEEIPDEKTVCPHCGKEL